MDTCILVVLYPLYKLYDVCCIHDEHFLFSQHIDISAKYRAPEENIVLELYFPFSSK